MARPVNRRVIEKPPIMEGFKPFGIPMHDLTASADQRIWC